MIPVVDARQMRRADRRAIASGIPSLLLMENAAAALVADIESRSPGWARIVVVCGPGNNGGDGLAAARLLARSGHRPALFVLGDPKAYSGDPADNLARARAAGLDPRSLTTLAGRRALAASLAEADGIVDALFGTGLTRPLTGAAARVVAVLSRSGRAVLSADVPSGLSSDSGQTIGPAVRAARTVALGAPKICHVLPPASELCGRVAIADIGIPRGWLASDSHRFFVTEAGDVRAALPARNRASHKGDFGRVAILGGSRGKVGASILAARGALRAGAGLVTVFCSDLAQEAVVSALPEAMTRGVSAEDVASERGRRSLAAELSRFEVVVAGPGLGVSNGIVRLLEEVFRKAGALVADADCLNAFAGRLDFFRRRKGPTVLTPHPGEAGRLLGSSAAKVQADRLGAARALALRSGGVAILKGASTLVAGAGGRVTVNPTGTPLMATGGSGDVLAGIVGALLASGVPAEEAARAGTYLHGLAGELLEERQGDAGLLASELADAVPLARRAVALGDLRESADADDI